MVCLAIGIKILKLSAYQNQVNQELSMAAMLLMDKDNIKNICREDLTDMISGTFGSNWPSSFIMIKMWNVNNDDWWLYNGQQTQSDCNSWQDPLGQVS